MGNRGRFDIFADRHIGFGIRWRPACYYSGLEISFAFPGFTVVIATGKRDAE